MMSKKIIVLILVVLAALLAIMLYLNIERAAIYVFAKTNGLDIGYSSIKRGRQTGEFLLRDMTAAQSKSGIGLHSGEAKIKLLSAGGPGGTTIFFDMKDVNFIKAAPSESSYGDVQGLVAGAFSKNVRYGQLRGTVTLSGDVITLKDFAASGDLMKVVLSGRMSGSGDVFADCVINFSNEIKQKIPRELSDVLLKEDMSGWPSLSVHIEGNYKAPAISVSGRNFRLNIREIVNNSGGS